MLDEPAILAIDQGSTATKAGLVSSNGEILRLAEARVATTRRGPQVEHDPDAIWKSIVQAVAELEIGGERQDRSIAPAALALACQRSTCLLWVRQTGTALTPALSWQDTSTAERVEALASSPALETRVSERTGLRLSPHYAAPKLAQLLDQTPGARERAERGEIVAGTLDAFLVQRLTGRARSEPGCAGRTLLYNLDSGRWDEELCSLFSVPPPALPELAPSTGDWGEVGPALPGAEGLPFHALLGDQQAALFAHSGWGADAMLVHFGTGAFSLAATGSELYRHPGLLSAALATTLDHAAFQLEAPVNSAGSAIAWAARLAGEELEAWSDRPLDYGRLPLLVPAFNGLAAPWWRPRACALMSGLALEHDGAALLGAAILGVAHRVVDGLEALADAGVNPQIVLVSGKLTRLSGLVQALADLGRRPIGVLAEEESGLIGVAALARSLSDRKGRGTPPRHLAANAKPLLPASAAREQRQRWHDLIEEAMASGERN